MNEKVKEIYSNINDVFGLPQKYKEVNFYPLLVKDFEYAGLLHALFSYPKIAASSTKRLFLMSYLKFMLQEMSVGIENIEKFFKYITRKENVSIEIFKRDNEELKTLDDAILFLNIDGVMFSEEEFENLREIILEQNGSDIDYINQYDPSLEENLQWMNREYPLTFNDQIFTLSALFKSRPEEIAEWTLYQLIDIFDRIIVLKQYEIYEPLLASGQVKMKGGKLQSYLYHKKKKNRYDSILMSQEEFAQLESELVGGNNSIK